MRLKFSRISLYEIVTVIYIYIYIYDNFGSDNFRTLKMPEKRAQNTK